MHTKQVIKAGNQTGEATKALVMLHGRGGSAEDILGLAQYLPVNDFALFAPQATNNTWYPYSFLAAPKDNEPWLSGALAVVKELVADIEASGIKPENIYFLGFSQGACLTLEYVTRNAAKYGGAVAFTGGLIGDRIYKENYSGDFAGTPVFIGTSDPDPHVPVDRVLASTQILTDMHAQVTQKIYKNMGHTINQDEINQASELIFKES
ncbi:phospholipase [Niastella yeongjuensis]|uniref:Phospholipase n=1 Tax=Niastella yeongjuensis TaxID=354355 RepID=A0A1V9F7X2_9BACT|nr:dienelactone hydrolase family protein [Niastella yeongjuensis]OQP54513.1 phospholipase [Niastella yeongjuensis]SEN97353.1 phospholipase/carboxylesterase [Niastella yeongjuensis]